MSADEHVHPRACTADLTPRQISVACLVAQAWPLKRIAFELGITRRTVRFHIEALAYVIHADPALDTRTQIARWWWEQTPDVRRDAA